MSGKGLDYPQIITLEFGWSSTIHLIKGFVLRTANLLSNLILWGSGTTKFCFYLQSCTPRHPIGAGRGSATYSTRWAPQYRTSLRAMIGHEGAVVIRYLEGKT